MIDSAKFKERLQSERLRIVRLLGWSEGEFRSHEKPSVTEAMPQSGDSEYADSATETFNQELDAAVVRRFTDKLQAVDAALKRLEVGEFGRCSRCGREIPERRLEAVPEIPYCIGCARQHESLG
ncbi:MAG: TraR/DksA C4-type zinc finger protein [Candidatus Sericytochromatia bacterium]|nr:TraR/DksA C4-type zinc finger protein [Candidatus Tanganyikabacteria bacterium]